MALRKVLSMTNGLHVRWREISTGTVLSSFGSPDRPCRFRPETGEDYTYSP